MNATTLAADTPAPTALAAPPAQPVPTSVSWLRWGLMQRTAAATVAGAGLWTAVLWALGGPT
jgi:hypothetical protein